MGAVERVSSLYSRFSRVGIDARCRSGHDLGLLEQTNAAMRLDTRLTKSDRAVKGAPNCNGGKKTTPFPKSTQDSQPLARGGPHSADPSRNGVLGTLARAHGV